MRNKFICVLGIVFVLFLLTFIPTQANSEISVYLNGEKINFDTSPMLVDGRTLVPFRGILEELGAEVRYEDGVAAGETAGKLLLIPIGENYVMINACRVEIDVPSQIVNGRTMVPLRVVSECLGAGVDWNGNTQTVSITTNGDSYINWNDDYFYWGDITEVEGNLVANGYGTIYRKTDEFCLCMGYFENDVILEGRLNYSDGSFYVGEFSKSQVTVPNGEGTKYESDGSYIQCTWVNNKMGDGDFWYYSASDNVVLLGKYVNGQLDGEITLYDHTTGEVQTEIYKNGIKVTENNINSDSGYINSIITSNSTAFAYAKYPLYLFSNDSKVYLGKLSTNKYDTDSISNPYGNYGSKYSTTSIFNEYGTYGSKYSSESAFNTYALEPPIIVDSNGKFVAYLTENKYNVEGVTYTELLSILKKYNQ